MKILASGDHHFDQHRRFDECTRVHAWMVELAREQKIDLFVSGGDVYERASTPLEREAVADWLVAMAEHAPVLIAKGNHDRRKDCAILGRLKSRHPIVVEEAAAVHWVGRRGQDKAAVAAVAWPDRGAVLAALGSAAAEHADAATHEALCNVLRGLGDELDREQECPRLLLGHFMCDGAETSTGQPLLGQPIRVGLSDLALARADLILMSHIHKAQRWDCAGSPALYMGSPFRTDFGQLEPKSVVLAEFRGRDLVEVTEVETPSTAMVHLEGDYIDEAMTNAGEDLVLVDKVLLHNLAALYLVKGAEVRLRYNVEREHRERGAAAAARLRDEILEHGAVSVKVEPIVVTTKRARAPEVARAVTVADKLTAFWPAVGFDPGARREALIAKANEVETEAHDAA